MSEPFLAEIKMVAFDFAPRGWALCDGAILPISQNQSLYSLLGTTYGGDGRTTFALPDLRGRVPIHVNSDASEPIHALGQKSGAEAVPLSTSQMPRHTHQANISSGTGSSASPQDNLWASVTSTVGSLFADPGKSAPNAPLNDPVVDAGSGQPHNNMQPYLTLNFCICIQGLFPSRS